MRQIDLPPFFLGPRCPVSLTKHLDPVKGGRPHTYVDKIGTEPKYMIHLEPGTLKILDML